METCEWCYEESDSGNFSAVVQGSDKNLCKTCFFLYINNLKDELFDRKRSPLNH